MSEQNKIIRLFNQKEKEQNALVSHIEDLLEMAKKGEIKNFMIAAEHEDNTVLTGYCNLNLVQKQLMVSHIQIDIMYQVTEANMDRLVEVVYE